MNKPSGYDVLLLVIALMASVDFYSSNAEHAQAEKQLSDKFYAEQEKRMALEQREVKLEELSAKLAMVTAKRFISMDEDMKSIQDQLDELMKAQSPRIVSLTASQCGVQVTNIMATNIQFQFYMKPVMIDCLKGGSK